MQRKRKKIVASKKEKKNVMKPRKQIGYSWVGDKTITEARSG